MSESNPGAMVGESIEAELAVDVAAMRSMSTWLRTNYYTYHQGPRPRIGEVIAVHGDMGVVVAHLALEESIYVRMETGERVMVHKSEITSLPAQRLSLHDTVLLYAKEAVNSTCSVSIAHLAVHFAGGNGLRYAHRQAELWMYRALVYMGYVGPHTSDLAKWLNNEIEKERSAGLEQLPDMIPEGDMGQVDRFYMLPVEERHARVDSQFAVQHGLALAAEQIKLTLTDGDETPVVEGLERCLAVDVHTERTVVIVCPAGDFDSGRGSLVAIDLDTLWPYVKHISGLELTGEAIDPRWFWDVLTASAIEHPVSAAYIGFIGNLQGPDGVDADVPERRRVAVIAALIAMACAFALNRLSVARRYRKQAKELLRGLDKGERSRLVAVVPDLIKSEMPKTLPHNVAEKLTAMFGPAVEDMVRALGKGAAVDERATEPVQTPAPAPVPVQAPIAASKTNGSDLDVLDAAYDPGLSEVVAAPSPAAASSEDAKAEADDGVPVPRRRREKVRFTPAARALRFAVTEKLLFAAEWKLADVPNAHGDAVAVALEWLEQRLGMTLPKHWSEGAHEIERAGVTVQIEAASRLFAFRLEHPDTEHPTRWWRVEATVLSGHDDAISMVGLRLQVRDLVEGLPAPARSVPGLVRSWSSRPGLIIAGARAGNVTHMRQGDSLGRLVKIIRNVERETLVCVVREGGVRMPVQGPLAGLVRVIVVPDGFEGYEAEFGELRADHVHLFWPGQRKPEFFSTSGPDWLADLRERALDARHRPASLTFASVRDAIRTYRKDRADQLADRLAEVEAVVVDPGPSMEDLQSARREASELEGLLDVAENERDRANEERELARLELEEALAARDAAKAEAEALRHALARLQAARGAAVEPPPAAEAADVPETLEGLPDWAPSIEPRVVIADKALRHAVKVDHRETHKIYAALQGLHDHYWAMRFAESDEKRVAAREAWRQFAQHHRFVVSHVGQAIRTGRYQDEYKATVDGVSYMASLHLSGSSAKDTARCLRVYMDIDEANRRLVVTHLPTHLTNSLT